MIESESGIEFMLPCIADFESISGIEVTGIS